jgi:hypothetical protein
VKKSKTQLSIKTVLLSLLLLPVISGVAWAATSANPPASAGNPLTTPTDSSESTTLPQRLSQRKTALKVQLSSAQAVSIAKGCSVAQLGIQEIKTKGVASANTRHETYTKLATDLNAIIDHLERESINTAALKSAQTKFNTAINKYLTDAESYKTTMDDGVVMDCVADAAGFQATLLSARQFRTQLSSDVSAIKAAVPDLSKALSDAKDILVQADNKKAQ